MGLPAARRWPILGRRELTCDQAEALVRRLFGRTSPAPFTVQLWDGRRVQVGLEPQVTFGFKDAEVFRRCLGSGDPAEFAESFTEGRLRIEGDLEAAARVALGLRTVDPGFLGKLAVMSALGMPGSGHSAREDERDVRAHYDLSNAFFELFLDRRLVYSCAYFATPDQSLEQAQARKLDLICRKLALAPGDRFLDLGCGWGGLLIWAASRYGVRAHGLTLSINQHAEATRRIEAEGLQERAVVERGHYEALPVSSFDAVASVGMYEHVGLKRLADYCRAVSRTLRPGGLFLNHGITLPAGPRDRTGGQFIFRHIFPGAEIVPLATIQAALERTGFEILDVHSLRPHYALTLSAWLRRFECRRAEAVRLSSERIVRMWEAYLAGCAEAFREGLVSVHQILAIKPGGRREPRLTRKAWEIDLAT